MDTLGILAIITGIIGIAGGVVPMLPGPPLSWVALLLAYFSTSCAEPVSKTALVVWLLLATVITIADYVLPAKLTKVTGGHKAAERGAMIGLFAGMILTPVGMVAGSFLGAFIGEFAVAGQDIVRSLKAACGAFIAFILTMGMKVIFSAILLWVILVHLF